MRVHPKWQRNPTADRLRRVSVVEWLYILLDKENEMMVLTRLFFLIMRMK